MVAIIEGRRASRKKTAEREYAISELDAKGFNQGEIAATLGLSRATVNKILGKIARRANKAMVDRAIEEKQIQLNRLQYVYTEAMQAWEKSKGKFHSVKQKTVKESIGNVPGIVTKEETMSSAEERDGNPAFLATAMQAMADIRKLLGLDAPLKNFEIDLTKLTDAQLVKIRNGEDPLNVLIAPADGSSRT